MDKLKICPKRPAVERCRCLLAVVTFHAFARLSSLTVAASDRQKGRAVPKEQIGKAEECESKK